MNKYLKAIQMKNFFVDKQRFEKAAIWRDRELKAFHDLPLQDKLNITSEKLGDIMKDLDNKSNRRLEYAYRELSNYIFFMMAKIKKKHCA